MHTEIVRQIIELPIAERVEIIEEVSRSVRHDLRNAGLSDEQKRRRSKAIQRLKGIASVPGKNPPSDNEWREERTNYLLEKHK